MSILLCARCRLPAPHRQRRMAHCLPSSHVSLAHNTSSERQPQIVVRKSKLFIRVPSLGASASAKPRSGWGRARKFLSLGEGSTPRPLPAARATRADVWGPATIILMTTGEVWRGIALAPFCGPVVGGVDNVLRPRLVGQDTKMHGLLIFFSRHSAGSCSSAGWALSAAVISHSRPASGERV
jgi:hypothetical protein